MQPLGDNTVNVPAFLGKLWKMVNDPETDHLICWNSAGNSFVIQNQAQFWYDLLPVYYKHNNMSSFVRQLNMYGFHKVSCVENGTMDADKDEIIFYHPYFQKGKIELLKNIKRKVTGPKVMDPSSQTSVRGDEITKVLVDVKQIRGRQAAVDSQLSAMKQENAVLWRELALLRQKHMKQQQIVNKLIHFLITLVQPSRMGMGVKRRYPLMLCEKPLKRNKRQKTQVHHEPEKKMKEGPTIHELDAELEFGPEELYEEQIDECPAVDSPEGSSASSTSSKADSAYSSKRSTKSTQEEYVLVEGLDEGSRESITPDTLWDKPDLVKANDYIISDDGEIMNTLHNLEEEERKVMAKNDTEPMSAPPDVQKVFLNPSAQDTLLSNLINGSYNMNTLSSMKATNGKKMNSENKADDKANVKKTTADKSLALATKDATNPVGDIDELHTLVGSTENDLDQLKDILSNCNGFDANALLGLFNDESPDYGLSLNPSSKDSIIPNSSDPLVSGSELTTYGINMIDFNELFDNADDSGDYTNAISPDELNLSDSSLNTPRVESSELMFPVTSPKQ